MFSLHRPNCPVQDGQPVGEGRCSCRFASNAEERRVKTALTGVGEHQQQPLRNDQACVQDMVIADIDERKRVGLERYGTLLQPFNGRDMLLDAYQEALDLAIYLRGAIEERRQCCAGC